MEAYTRCDAEINNEHSSSAKTSIKTILEDPNNSRVNTSSTCLDNSNKAIGFTNKSSLNN
jgi:hypothetical protein